MIELENIACIIKIWTTYYCKIIEDNFNRQ